MNLVRERRLARGWSQTVLGQRVGRTKQYISELERGNLRPSLVMVRRLAAALQVSDADLLDAILPNDATDGADREAK
jgi:transcriptional regulator with XRE-family HTH domain